MATKPRNGHTGGPNPPDYVCPKRRERRPLTIYLSPEVKAAMIETARRNGITMQDVGEQLCKAYVETAGRVLDPAKKVATPDLPSGHGRQLSGSEVADGLR